MRLPVALGLLALLLAAPSPAATPAAPAPAPAVDLGPLLQRLAEAERAREARAENRTMEVTTVSEELDGKGQPEKRTETVVRRTVKEGKATSELVRVLEDGKDVTEAKRAKFEERQREAARKGQKARGGGTRGVRLEASPFAPDEQPRYQFEPRPARPSDPAGHQRIALRPRGKPEEGMLQGEAVVDAAAGELVRFEGTLAKLPRFADRVSLAFEFGPVGPTGHELTRTRVDGEGGLLFVRKRVRAETRFAYLD